MSDLFLDYPLFPATSKAGARSCRLFSDSGRFVERKSLVYLTGSSQDEVTDVSRRYTADFSQLQPRRRINEHQLSLLIDSINTTKYSHNPATRQQLLQRRLYEEIDLNTRKSASESEKQGRSSGSLAWRLSRGETKPATAPKSYIFKPSQADLDRGKFSVQYDIARDEYRDGCSGQRLVKGWSVCVGIHSLIIL